MFSRKPWHRVAVLLFSFAAGVSLMSAQGTVGWLRYAIPPDPPRYHALPHTVVLLGNSAGQAAPEELAAADELDRGLGHMVAGTDVLMHRFDVRLDSIVLGTTDALHHARIGQALPGWTEKALPEEGFRIVHLRRGVREWYILQGGSPRAELWAAFRFAALVAEDQQLPEDFTDVPHVALRAVNMGRAADLLPLLESTTPRSGLARLLASVGINGLLVEANAAEFARVQAVVRPYGIRVWLRSTSDTAVDEAARLAASPGFGGLLLPVPERATVQQLRSVVQQANTQARLLRHTGAAVLLEDALGPPLREAATEPADAVSLLSPEERSAVLRGGLEGNIILGGAASLPQVSLSGLGSANFGLLPGVPQAAVLQVLGRSPDVVAYPAPAWAAVLQTPERGLHGDTTLAALLSGSAGEAGLRGGLIGMLPTDAAERMLQQPLLQANLYAFGRLTWSPAINVETMTDEWSRQTWGDDARAYAIATRILLESTAAAAKNRTPLGLPLLAGATGAPDPASATRIAVAGVPLADASNIGVDRTARGTNEASRYPDDFAAALADPARCPEPWLLLFHRMPYGAILQDGKSVAQSFYDAHFAGAAQAGNALDAWESTHGLVDEPRYASVHAFLARASTHAEIWREKTTEWLQRISGMRDTLGFVGNHPGRIEAEQMQASGYAVTKTGLESDSGGERMTCRGGDCTIMTLFSGEENVYRVEVGYVDEHQGCAFELLVNGEVRARWQDSPTHAPAEAERFVVNGVRLQPGDSVAIHAHASGGAEAPLDFVEITRDPRWN